jgi:hypothetical protein
MSLLFVFAKALNGIIDTPYDKIIFLVLLDLDIIALFTALRWWKIWK